jgi:hypothetical protein
LDVFIDTDANWVTFQGILGHFALEILLGMRDTLLLDTFIAMNVTCLSYCESWDSVATSVTFLKLLLPLVQGDTFAILPFGYWDSMNVTFLWRYWGYCCHEFT